MIISIEKKRCYGSFKGVKSWGLELENTKFSRYVSGVTKHGD